MEIDVSAILPNKVSNYTRTLEIRTVTDRTASRAIARFGLERRLDNWSRPKDIFREPEQLTRERNQIVEERAMAKDQRCSERSEAMPDQKSLERVGRR